MNSSNGFKSSSHVISDDEVGSTVSSNGFKSSSHVISDDEVGSTVSSNGFKSSSHVISDDEVGSTVLSKELNSTALSKEMNNFILRIEHQTNDFKLFNKNIENKSIYCNMTNESGMEPIDPEFSVNITNSTPKFLVFQFSLDSNPSTGYHWVASYDTSKLKLIDTTFVSNSTSPLICGAPGVETFTFERLSEDIAEVTLNLIAPDGSIVSSKTFVPN